MVIAHQLLLEVCQGVIGGPGLSDGCFALQGDGTDCVNQRLDTVCGGLVFIRLLQLCQGRFCRCQGVVIPDQSLLRVGQLVICLPGGSNGLLALQGDGVADGGNQGLHCIGCLVILLGIGTAANVLAQVSGVQPLHIVVIAHWFQCGRLSREIGRTIMGDTVHPPAHASVAEFSPAFNRLDIHTILRVLLHVKGQAGFFQ